MLATLGAAVSVVIAFRSRLGTREKTAIFLAATVLAAPHSGPYDGTLLVIAAAFWLMARRAPLPLWCWTLAFMIWQLGEETMRLALAHKRSEGALLVDAYKRMSLRAIAEP